MALTPSTMLPLGTKLPSFTLINTISGKPFSSGELMAAKGVVIAFICNHCPFVHHTIDEFIRVARDYRVAGIDFVAISSNDIEKYPQDRPEMMKEYGEKLNFPFPYLYDASQEVARAFDAACTPDFYVFDAQRKLVYRGQLDDSRPSNGIVSSGASLRSALDAVIGGKPMPSLQKPSIGCSIKWKV